MNILLAEDDARVSKYLIEALHSEGYVVVLCKNLSELQDQIDLHTLPFEVAIFDRMLQTEDSLSLLRAYKKVFPLCRVLILSAINSPEEKVRALDEGADDYLAKPYSLLELKARLRALVRRDPNSVSSRQNNLSILGNLQIDRLAHQVSVDGKRLDLTNKEFRLLSYLSEHPGRVWTRLQLLDSVWDTQLDLESNVVESTIRNLRRKLESVRSTIELASRRNVGYWVETKDSR